MRQWLVDGLIGGAAGALAGAIVAVNVVIALGPDTGYESTIPEVFAENAAVGVLTVVILVAGPVLGVVVARRARRRRGPSAGR